jgi:formate hydrogenlyase transcriptional activator
VLQEEHEVERLGGHSPIKVDVRVIAATNRDLEAAVARGTFREDLYYRLNLFPLRVPPLRQRMEDIPLLVRYFLQRYTTRIGREIVRVPDDVMCRLTEYSWPGNVRELANVIERALIVSKGAELRLPAESLTPPAPCLAATDGSATFLKRPLRIYDNAQTEPMTLEQIERNHIIFVLDRTGWRIEGGNGAALILNLKPSTLRSRMKKLGISRTEKGG